MNVFNLMISSDLLTAIILINLLLALFRVWAFPGTRVYTVWNWRQDDVPGL